MSRMFLVSSFIIGLLCSFAVNADIPVQTLRGHMWLDLTPSGVYLRVDRQNSDGPDGSIDDEYFLMMRAGVVARVETLDLGEASMISTARSVAISAPRTHVRYVLILEGAAASSELLVPDSQADPLGEDLGAPTALPAGRDVQVTALEGYGIRYRTVSVSRDEVVRDPSWQREIATNEQCDAGGGCFAASCRSPAQEGRVVASHAQETHRRVADALVQARTSRRAIA